MRAGGSHDADAAVAVAERHQVFAEKPQQHRIAVGLGDLLEQRRQPVAAHQLAHGRVAFDAAYELILVVRQHGSCLREDNRGLR